MAQAVSRLIHHIKAGAEVELARLITTFDGTCERRFGVSVVSGSTRRCILIYILYAKQNVVFDSQTTRDVKSRMRARLGESPKSVPVVHLQGIQTRTYPRR